MISESPVWINILPTDLDKLSLTIKITGKWLCYGPKDEIHLYKDLINALVEKGIFLSAKMAKKDPDTDPFPHKECVLCVFTSSDEDEKERVRNKLIEIDLNPVMWKSDAETEKDWEKDGILKLESEIVKKKKYIKTLNHDHLSSKTQYDLFICYRRKPDYDAALLIATLLGKKGYSVFIDIDEIKSGHFGKKIFRSIESSPNFIVLLSEGTLDKCNDEGDWVRKEVEYALQLNSNIIPIIRPGFSFKKSKNIPESMSSLSMHNWVEYSQQYRNAMINKIISFLKP